MIISTVLLTLCSFSCMVMPSAVPAADDIQEISISVSPDGYAGKEIDNGCFSLEVPDGWSYSDWRDDPAAQDTESGVLDYHAELRKPGVYRIYIRAARSEFTSVDTGRRATDPKAAVSITADGQTWSGYHGLLNGDIYICRLNQKEGDWTFSVSIEKYQGVISEEDTDLLQILAGIRKI